MMYTLSVRRLLVMSAALIAVFPLSAEAYSFLRWGQAVRVGPTRSPVYNREAVGTTHATLSVQAINGTMGSIPPGTTRVPMLTLRFTASCGANVPVHSVTLWHRGLGALDDILSVYAIDGGSPDGRSSPQASEGRRLTRGRTFSSHAGELSMPLRTFVVPSCESRELNFLVDFASTASPAGEHRLEIFSESDIDAAATIKLTTALTTKARRTVGRRVGQVSVSFINLTNPIRYGPDQRVARIKLSADNQDDHLVQAITFTNDGTARDNDLTDFYLETSYGQRVTSITQQMFEDQARIVFNPPYLLKRGRDRIFNLRAAANVTNRSVQFIVEEPSDIDVQRVHVRSMRRY